MEAQRLAQRSGRHVTRRLASCVLAASITALACAPSAVPPAPPPVVPAPPAPAGTCPSLPLGATAVPARTIAPDERVPDFMLETEACDIFDSRDLVGKQPFVVVFFASWCSVCEEKVPALRDALARRADRVTPLWVSLDEAGEGWSEIDEFLSRHALRPRSAVAGQAFLEFSLGYNPFRSVPVVIVVGRSGRVVAVQIGVREGDEVAFERALDQAIAEPPERTLLTSARRP
jgi:hypothetical protein